MIVDCMTCPVRDQNCDDCAVTVLLAPGSAERLPLWDLRSSEGLELDTAERRVVSIFVGAGLVDPSAAATLRASRDVVLNQQAVRNVG